jgi:hypothetical protein
LVNEKSVSKSEIFADRGMLIPREVARESAMMSPTIPI